MLTREEAFRPGAATLIHKAGSVAQPDVYLIENETGSCVLKDFAARPWLVRVLLGRRVLRHEHDILRRLCGVDGVPTVIRLLDADGLMMEYIGPRRALPANPDDTTSQSLSPGSFQELKDTVSRMHARGVVHGDIRKGNLVWRCDGSPVILDFASALCRDGPLRFLRGPLWRLIATVDEIAVLRLKSRYCPESLQEEEKSRLARLPLALRAGRFLRHSVYRRFIKQKRWAERLRRLRGGTVERLESAPTSSGAGATTHEECS